ncbi:TIGR01212 family radical SAM protein [Roseiconus lacunae]|uniref:TIGR01212 family radical SAM protein n=1 Tax=Roseiconus lacunae TaxID=2605694 RepID=A0ABT7PMY8_9BACT|nr:TIGR01212 family radical SAM protein [Roseiconus lacunae]MDM4017845.1 TIGR01212 family radical SAM protein [Roseiconus lacunae]
MTISGSNDRLAWQREGLPFNAFGAFLRRRFGGRVQRVSIDAGFTCPNVDGAVARGGCNFCDNRSFSPSRRVRLKRVSEQLENGIESVRRRYKTVSGFLAYFQPATNTYAPVDQLEEVYRLALRQHPDIVGLAIGTRPDCVPDCVLELAEQLAREHYVSLEFGMQTMHQPGLDWMNRAHTHDHLVNAIDRARSRGFECCVHIILGIPGETHEMMMQTATEVARLGFDAIKLHNLYAVQGTSMGDEVAGGKIKMMEQDTYVNTVVDFLELIPPTTVVERISGDAPPKYLIAPQWCLKKSVLKQQIEEEFQRRNSYQGKHYVAPQTDPNDRPRPTDNTPQSIRDQIDVRGRLPVLKIESAH